MTSLGTLPGWSVGSLANAINESGQVVGWSYKYSPGTGYHPQPHAFLQQWIDDRPWHSWGRVSYAYALNNSGQVVGYASIPDGNQHAFLYSGGVISDLGTLGGSAATHTGSTTGQAWVILTQPATAQFTPFL